jgi:hypothetical protein
MEKVQATKAVKIPTKLKATGKTVNAASLALRRCLLQFVISLAFYVLPFGKEFYAEA